MSEPPEAPDEPEIEPRESAEPDDRASALAETGGDTLKKADGAKPGKEKAPAEAPKTILEYFKTRHDPLTGLVLTIPIFLIYHLGILTIDLRNGVDVVSRITFALLEQSTAAYVGVTLGFAAVIAIALFVMRKTGRLRPAKLLPVMVESLVLALILAGTVGWATGALVPNQVGAKGLNALEAIVMSAGAGFHEELIFRVLMLGGGIWLLIKAKSMKPWMAFVAMLIISSLLFSLAHFVGPGSDTFAISSFTFRFLAGAFLGVVYRFRGIAVAVYTHTIYDILVFFFFW